MTLQFTFKTVCGRQKYYPTDAVSKAFVSFAHQKCLGQNDFANLFKIAAKNIEVFTVDGELMKKTEVIDLLMK